MSRLAVCCLSILLALTACQNPVTTEPTDTQPASTVGDRSALSGFTLSPSAWTSDGLSEFFDIATETSTALAWVGPWTELTAEGGAAEVTYELATRHGLAPVIVVGFADGAVPTVSELLDAIGTFLIDREVAYLGVGVEVDVLYENRRETFDWLVSVFPDVVELVHRTSPSTRVFTVFQLEHLRGLRGGLFGGQNDTSDHRLELLSRFPAADAVGFTTYPGLVFTDPTLLPDNYYSAIRDWTDKPIVFTEMGWQAGGELGDWSGTPEAQANYVEVALPELMQSSELVIWSFLWDQPTHQVAFATMGLIAPEGDRRPALGEWQRVSEPTG